MIVTALPKCADGSDFSVISLVDDHEIYSAEIYTKPAIHKVELKTRDYFRILLAYENNRRIKIFPNSVNNDYLLDISEPL
jgi:hypothetical protein